MRTAIRHLTRVGAAVAVTAVLVGSSAHATTTPVVSHHDGHRAFTPVPGHNSSEWLMMGLHCGASLS